MSGKYANVHSKRRRRNRVTLMNATGGHCYWCQHPLVEPGPGCRPYLDDAPDGKRWATIDHVIPRSAGGQSDLSNEVIACHVCNLERSKDSDPFHGVKGWNC